ncbi:MAG: biotin/lipoyl-binding protein, partial [Acetobacteraceae bacterium]|nr:biotin/lipoyl-binding protein [Acetobacteraceae bacterium]
MTHVSQDLREKLPRETQPQPPPDPSVPQRRRRVARLLVLGAVLVLGAAIAFGAWHHVRQRAEADATLAAMQAAVPVVRTEMVKAVNTPREVVLPGSMQAWESATLYARATGYISVRNVDIGSRVHAGDLLVQISAPDLDQQLAQARAQLVQMQAQFVQSQANMELAKVTNRRTSTLVVEGWSAKQQGDTDRLNYAASI